MTRILKGKCFYPGYDRYAWDVRLFKPEEAGTVVNGWLVLDEGQPKDEDMYYRCVHISRIDVFENNGERYFVCHDNHSIISFNELYDIKERGRDI